MEAQRLLIISEKLSAGVLGTNTPGLQLSQEKVEGIVEWSDYFLLSSTIYKRGSRKKYLIVILLLFARLSKGIITFTSSCSYILNILSLE